MRDLIRNKKGELMEIALGLTVAIIVVGLFFLYYLPTEVFIGPGIEGITLIGWVVIFWVIACIVVAAIAIAVTQSYSKREKD